MIKSMTGYGRAENTLNGCTITVELRSVNNRYLDCNVRIPRLYLFAEESIKSRVQNTISRGKVDVFVTLDNAGAEKVQVSVNKPVADGYYAALKQLAADYDLAGDISVSLLSRFPDVLLAEKAEEDVEQMAKDICSVLDRALADFDQMRSREGQRLKDDVLSRAKTIEDKVALVEERSPQTVAEYRAKLEADKTAGALLPDEAAARTRTLALLTAWSRSLDNGLDADEAFDTVRGAFNTQVQRREEAVSAASNALEFAFDFMEQAFEDGQEMVVFVNELALGPDSAPFLAENDCERFEQYSEKLLLHGGEDELLAELQRDDVRAEEHSAEF